uniref:cDNA FLJ25155 fis, clone CBR07976 n=1 Tax=Homo sapiens TaxID=9606 RepID=Q96LR6_HUMAN|nr:unnamed protein product [Homo sapiens]
MERYPGQRLVRPGSCRGARGESQPHRPGPVPAHHLTSAGTGKFSAAAFSSNTESVCLSVSGAVVSGLRSQRASFSLASRSAAASGSSNSAASAIAAALAAFSSSEMEGTPTERPGPLPGEPELPTLHRRRGGTECPDPGNGSAVWGAGPRPVPTWL